jgi:drug/metabolite transporter (DMT)-like permease
MALMLLSAAGFTANILLIRALGQFHAVNVWLISCARFIVGIAIIYLVYSREFAPTHLFTNRKLIGRGLVGGLGVYGTYLTVVEIGAGRAILIGNTYVVFSALMAAVWLGEKLRPAFTVGAVVTIAGLALLTNVFSHDAHPSFYDLIAVGVALASAYVVVTIRQLHRSEHTSTIFGAQCVYGLIICGVPALLHTESIPPFGWVLLILASLCAGAGQITMTRAFRELPAGEGSLWQMLVPPGVAFGGWLFFGEHFSPAEYTGAALILIGTAWAAIRR